MKYLFLDLETPNRKNHSICSISLQLFNDNEELYNEYFLLNPHEQFDDVNINIHHITPKMVENEISFADFYEKTKNIINNSIIVGHNVTFDLSVLSKTLYLNNFEVPSFEFIDTMRLAKYYERQCCSLKLSELCSFYNIDFGVSHYANDDATACKNLFFTMLEKFNFNPEYEINDFYFDSSSLNLNNSQNKTFTETTLLLQELKIFAAEIIEDDTISVSEIENLYKWLSNNLTLQGNYPFDKVYELCCSILKDGIIKEDELTTLMSLLSDIVNPLDALNNYCEVIFNDKTFCLTGNFMTGSKKDIKKKIEDKGGIVKDSLTQKTNYLVVGGAGNDSWKFGNYGNKVSKALQWQDEGLQINIITENDLMNCLNNIF